MQKRFEKTETGSTIDKPWWKDELYSKCTSNQNLISTEISEEEIINIIKNTKRRKTLKINKIKYDLLKNLPNVSFLKEFFNKVKNEEIEMSKAWKEGNLILLYKKNDKLDVNNYKPITLLNTIYKIYTCIINNKLKKYVKKTPFLVQTKEDSKPTNKQNTKSLNSDYLLKMQLKIKIKYCIV
jgi:hypothetical protein